MNSEERLRAQGWTKRNTIDEPRLGELVRMYSEMGLEVHTEPLHPEEMDGCDECMRKEPERYMTIYTRPAEDGGEDDLEDLF